MSNNKRGVTVARQLTGAALLLALPLAAHALTVEEITETNRRVKDMEARVAEAKVRADLDKLGGSAASAAPTAPRVLAPERSIDDGVALLSVTGPSADPIYLVQFRGVPLPLKVGREAMDGWTLDAVKGNALVLVRRDGKGRTVESKKVPMTDVSYASQREQQRLDAARMQATASMGQNGPMPPVMMPPGGYSQADKGPTP